MNVWSFPCCCISELVTLVTCISLNLITSNLYIFKISTKCLFLRKAGANANRPHLTPVCKVVMAQIGTVGFRQKVSIAPYCMSGLSAHSSQSMETLAALTAGGQTELAGRGVPSCKVSCL